MDIDTRSASEICSYGPSQFPRPLVLVEWEGKLYIDIFLPFGLRTASFMFNLFGERLHWIPEMVFSRDLVHYLEDSSVLLYR